MASRDILDGQAQVMKILHVIASVNPSCGGPSVSAPSLAGEQANLGHEVSLLVPANDEFEIYALTLPERLPLTRDLDVIGIPWAGILEQYFSELERIVSTRLYQISTLSICMACGIRL
jgi:hypothetical protein